mmetsp:Transcript_19821/g.29639  ORF Transcript_19821/g.29639 Transcript_19821/m.29639 type:complete len:859 (+) Transcript_19821:31-2607(+)
MAYLFRSEDMQYVHITMQRDRAEFYVKSLGEMSLIHVVNLADESSLKSEQMKEYKKRIVSSVQNQKRLEEIEKLMKEFDINIPDVEPVEVKIARSCTVEFDATWNKIERDLKTNKMAVIKLRKNIARLKEEEQVLLQIRDKINLEAQVAELKNTASNRSDMKAPLLEQDIELQGMSEEKKFYSYICGVIPVSQQLFFTRMLYRLSRGNAFVRYVDIDEALIDPISGQSVNKSVFYIVSIGRGLSEKLSKLCDFYQASIYTVPESKSGKETRITGINTDIKQQSSVLRTSELRIRRELRKLALNRESKQCILLDWRLTLHKEKILCETMMKTNREYLTMVRLDGWVPRDKVDVIKDRVERFESAGQRGSIVIKHDYDVDDKKFRKAHGSPPTYFRLNNITGVFQGIVNTYGVPRYKEVNPGLFTIVTFPFIFGVMYGDMGHGGALFLAAIYFLFYEEYYLEQNRKGEMGELMKYAFGARYALIFMGFFGFYCGTIYNDFISVPLQIFESQWTFPSNLTSNDYKAFLNEDKVYPYGVDYNWYHTKNELTFFNSLKMKMSVVLGVTQMLFGISLGAFNYTYFGDYLSLYFVWIPQMVFMICTFGYMCFMIILKWCQDYSKDPAPPALIQTMIKMFLSPGKIEAPLYSGQGPLQVVLLLVAVLTVPVMLLAKPLIVHNKNKNSHQPLLNNDEADEKSVSVLGDDPESVIGTGRKDSKIEDVKDDHKDEKDHEDDHEEHTLGSELIHSGIHTIEYVLGAVSNTASYLRLWALSLAHAQLAKVFWQKMIIEYGVETESDGLRTIMVVAVYAVWFCATFAVLMCMDLLECFLHALRLHWVEFQNKFYNADGYLFEPFSFEAKEED